VRLLWLLHRFRPAEDHSWATVLCVQGATRELLVCHCCQGCVPEAMPQVDNHGRCGTASAYGLWRRLTMDEVTSNVLWA
jgi:hypothetical protein